MLYTYPKNAALGRHQDLTGSVLNVVHDLGDGEKSGFQVRVKPVSTYAEAGHLECEFCGGEAVYIFDPTDDIGQAGVPLPYCQEHAVGGIQYELEELGASFETGVFNAEGVRVKDDQRCEHGFSVHSRCPMGCDER